MDHQRIKVVVSASGRSAWSDDSSEGMPWTKDEDKTGL